MSFGYQKRRPLTEEEKSSDVAKARARALETLAAQEVSSGQVPLPPALPVCFGA